MRLALLLLLLGIMICMVHSGQPEAFDDDDAVPGPSGPLTDQKQGVNIEHENTSSKGDESKGKSEEKGKEKGKGLRGMGKGRR